MILSRGCQYNKDNEVVFLQYSELHILLIKLEQIFSFNHEDIDKVVFQRIYRFRWRMFCRIII